MFWIFTPDLFDARPKPMSAALPDGYVVHMPQQEAPRHLFGPEKRVPPEDSVTGYEQKELTCLTCSAVCITVMTKQGDAWREWRQPGGTTQSRWPAKCTGVPAAGVPS